MGNNLVDNSLPAKYNRRLGDESYKTKEYGDPFGPEAGGLRSDYLSMFEGFVPYENVAQADSNLNDFTDHLSTRSPWVPQHQKYSFNFELDGALGYRTGDWLLA